MLLLFHFCFICLVTGLVSADSAVELLPFHESVTQSSFSSQNAAAVLPNNQLKQVSSSVLMAEIWTRKHVLAHYPSINITSIVVGHNLLCLPQHNDDDGLRFILPSVRNIHHALTRCGLQKDIKVSASFSSSCIHLQRSAGAGGRYRDDLAEAYIRPLLNFLQHINSPYFVNLSPSSSETEILLNTHLTAIRNLGFHNITKLNVIIHGSKEVKFQRRKLSFYFPFPTRPTPSPDSSSSSSPLNVAKSPLPPLIGEISSPPSSLPLPLAIDNSPPPTTGSSSPANVAKSPLPPLIGNISPSPPLSLPLPPSMPPLSTNHPAHPPHGFPIPPCSAPPPDHRRPGGAVAAPVEAPTKQRKGLWCVAKPSVPPETLQVALDFACGEGGADCEAIKPKGSCYYPDTVLAHASYAFNSYWQKTKKLGGTCGFEGTAILIDSDPSYRHCRFSLA